MSLDNLKTMKEQLTSCVQSALNNIDNVNTHELGEAVDMIKDLSEAIYYCTITESMEKSDKEDQEQTPVNINYYTPYIHDKRYPDYYRDIEREGGRMYYTPIVSGGRYNSTYDGQTRDPREGRSPIRRRMYMEGKELHRDVMTQMNELQAYLQELSTDITEMIKDASPEQKTALKQKMTTLASKIV